MSSTRKSTMITTIIFAVGAAGCESESTFELKGAVRGGAMYDSWWKVKEMDAPSGDHPLWDERPDKTSNTLTGADTWRCKECHGWDYKGVDGVYGSGSHRTGFPGILEDKKSESEIIDSLKNKHGYGDAGLSDSDLEDLAKFVIEHAVDVSSIVNGSKTFSGDPDKGKQHYRSQCEICHNGDGLNDKPTGSAGMFEDFPGKIADENPWEFQHKVRFGQPGTAMTPQAEAMSLEDIGHLGAHVQTLPTEL